MNTPQPALKPSESKAAEATGLNAVLQGLLGNLHAPTQYSSIRVNADWLCVFVSFACLVFAIVEGFAYGQVGEALMWGTPLFLGSLVVTRFYAGHGFAMHLNAVLLVGMGALHVHIARGLLEYHFSFFMLLPVMLAYRDIRPLVTMGLAIIIHHLVFDMLQQAGFACYVFRGPFVGIPAVALHGFYVAVEVAVLSVIAQTLHHHALVAEENAQLLANLGSNQRINLRNRVKPDDLGHVTPMGQMFNNYADNMGYVVASFKMLHIDIRELSQIAKELGADNNSQLQDSAAASRKLRDFVQNLGNQTRMGQSTAELSKKTTEDCFDLLNEVNQSIEHLNKMSKQAYDSHQHLQSLHRELSSQFSPNQQQSMANALSALDNLNERTNTFMSKMSLIKSGLSAIENQVVTVDQATHQWVENGHSNQRQGWEVLGAMESMQARAEVAFRTLGSTVQTILRSDELMREMDKRLSRFDV
jgi:flagellar biosynthesis chaperone FliJ